MSQLDLTNIAATSIATPGAGVTSTWMDVTTKIPITKDDAGGIHSFGTSNFSVANLAPAAATDTYITGSSLRIPDTGLPVGAMLYWVISASKTAAGIAAPIYTVRMGSLQTTADASKLVLTGPAQTAAADVGILEVLLTVRSVSAAGVIQGTAVWTHNLGAPTGFGGAVEGTSAGFDNQVATIKGLYVGLSVNTGTAGAWTITQVQGRISF